MAFRRKTSKRRVVRRRRPIVKRRRTVARRPALRREIKQVISRMAENKTQQVYVQDQPVPSSASVVYIEQVRPVSPHSSCVQLNQGTGAGNRIGNRVRTKSLTVKGTISALSYNATTNASPVPGQYKLFIFYDKRFPSTQPSPAPDFFQLGNNYAPFQNDLTDMWAPINDDIYRVVATRSFKLGFANTNGTGSSTTDQFYSNNDFKYNANFSINLTKHMSKIVTYDSTGTTPTSKVLWMMILPAAANGRAYSSTTIPAQVSYIVDYRFEDF